MRSWRSRKQRHRKRSDRKRHRPRPRAFATPSPRRATRRAIESDGKIVRDSSNIVVLLTGLKSDKSRRDGFLQRSTLETSKFPRVELVPVSFDGINAPLPSGASKTFALVGDLTVHGVTRPTMWHVTAHAEGNDIVGTAMT